ncbi:uncharacterized protein SCHCODRAFT_02505559 [Schizophyllum commune H4-8]|nr:uncharacterized protein SCHCODRAFT_02505559 [Schizophyllum commune H4-8]KAI5891275.1 hypothetical protein SCHCODRAFT_02505559 [Schizophyllum commune H4-8]
MAHLPVGDSSPYKVDVPRFNSRYREGNMVSARKIFVNYIGSVPQISIVDFLDHFMPPQKLDQKQIAKVSRKLCGKWHEYGDVDEQVILDKKARATQWGTKHAPYDRKHKVWSDYAHLPRQRADNEKTVYAAFTDMCDQVIACCKAVRDDLSPTTRLVSNGNTPLMGSKHNSAPCDAFHYLIGDHDHELDIYDCVCNVQYKKILNATNVQDNNLKVIWDLHQTMRMDPRRRFTFGMTFADTTVRLWHYNREVLVVSEAFDFNKNFKILIDVYARLSFATMPELGFDPTITLLPSSPSSVANTSPRQFRIAVDNVFYIATQVLADFCPEDGFGRCTRIFSAYKEGESVDKTFVIKDCWVEATRDTEFTTLKLIEADILSFDWQRKCHPPLDDVEDLASYKSDRIVDPLYGKLTPEERTRFFVPIINGVEVAVNGRPDDTQDVIANGYEFPNHRNMFCVDSDSVMQDGSRYISIWQGTVGNEADLAKPREVVGCFFRPIVRRKHHRLVMEKGLPLSQIKEARKAFSVVSDAAYGLFILHCIGWLHRDISADNILQMPNGRGVLADLEYTKRASDPRTRSFRTGTPDFLAIEVAYRQYLNAASDADDVMFRVKAEATDGDPDTLPWRFRDTHDLESIWWLCLWLLFHHTKKRRPAGYDLLAQSDTCNELFPGVLKVTQRRRELLTEKQKLAVAMRTLPPDWAAALEGYLTAVRNILRNSYKPEKRGRPLHPGTWWMVHNMCMAGTAIKDDLVWITRNEVDRLKERARKAQLKAAQQRLGVAGPGEVADKGDDVTMTDAPAREDHGYRRSTGKRNKRKTRDELGSVHDASSNDEDGSPRKRAKRGKPSKGNNEPRSSDKEESRPSRRDASHSSNRNASRSGGKHAARRDGTRG